jgi:gliding motility-associated-like protein
MTTVEITIETNPIADAGATATLNCNVTSTTLGGAGSSVGTDIDYLWIASNGGTVQNADQLYATATSAGTYTLTVINTITGCSSTDVVIIDQIGDFPTDLELTVLSPDCDGDPPGSAQVTDVIGGIEPYTYELNGGAPTNNPNFQDLEPGDYTLLVTDATGCEIETQFTVYDLVNVDLNIINYVNDTLIFDFKDTITLSYEYIGSTTIPDSLVWKSADTVMCIDCAVLEFPANLSGTITVEAYDVRGCFVTKSINYIVVRKREVYIPNVFSPNGDQLNDYFTLFTDSDVQEISKMEIYTRWGELVFSQGPMPPNDPSLGWDGTFRGQTLNPGVYVYRINILYGDGLKDQLAGDITIVR